MDVTQEFDTLHNNLLTNHYNKRGHNAGIILQVFYSGVALIGWGIYQVINFIGKQILPSTSNREWLEKHAKSLGITTSSTDTDDGILQAIKDETLRSNFSAWINWIKEVSYTHDAGLSTEWIETVKDVELFENARGSGTINFAITSDRTTAGFEEVATSQLVAAVDAYLDTKRPPGLWDVSIYSAAHLVTNVSMTIAATDFTTVQARAVDQIDSLLRTRVPAEGLSLAQITSAAIEAGATDVVLTTPSSAVSPASGPSSYERIWPGTITVGQI